MIFLINVMYLVSVQFFCKDKTLDPLSYSENLDPKNLIAEEVPNSNIKKVFSNSKSGLMLREGSSKDSKNLALVPYGSKVEVSDLNDKSVESIEISRTYVSWRAASYDGKKDMYRRRNF